MRAVKEAVIAIYNKEDELVGVVVRQKKARAFVSYKCEQHSEDEIIVLINGSELE